MTNARGLSSSSVSMRTPVSADLVSCGLPVGLYVFNNALRIKITELYQIFSFPHAIADH